MARLLDQDPFVLLLLRGRGERELLDELQVRSVPARPRPRLPGRSRPYEGVDAAEAYADGDILPPLPAPPPCPQSRACRRPWTRRPSPPPGVDPAALEFLARGPPARRTGCSPRRSRPGHEQRSIAAELTLAQDAVRLASGVPATPVAVRLADGSGRDREGLALAVRAWEHGGTAALAVLEDDRPAEAETLARARAALESAWEEDERPPLRASGNRWTVVGGRTQLRLGTDGRWWPYRKERGRWAPAGPASQDPATALAADWQD